MSSPRGMRTRTTEPARHKRPARGSELDGLGDVAPGVLRTAGGHAVEHGASRVGYRLFHPRVDPRMVARYVLRPGHRVRPAPAGLGLPEGTGIGILSAPSALDRPRLRADGDQRHAARLRDT